MNKLDMQKAVQWPSDLLEKGQKCGLGPPKRDINYIYSMIGDTTSSREDDMLKTHLPASVYSDYGIIANILDLRLPS